MTVHDPDILRPTPTEQRAKPRIAVMGEFSAGKSTLLNMLLNGEPLPVRITATSVPPVWISYGEDAAIRVRSDGTEEAFDPQDIEQIDLEDTLYIRLWKQADTLEICDLFDMPGISDPNMSSTVWQTAFEEVDCVIWCTHATQAWRQSEAATWEEIAGQTNGNNIMVVTQIDKIASSRDQERLLARVRKETKGSFQAVFPLAVLDAINASDEEQWAQSGAAAFSEHLVEMILRPSPPPAPAATDPKPSAEAPVPEHDDEAQKPAPSPQATEGRVVPRRVVRRKPDAVPNDPMPSEEERHA